MVKRSDPSFPCASLDAGLGLRLAYFAVDQEHKIFISYPLLLLIIVAEREGVGIRISSRSDLVDNPVGPVPIATDLLGWTGLCAQKPPYVLLSQSQSLIRDL